MVAEKGTNYNNDEMTRPKWVRLQEIMFGTGLPLDVIEDRIEACGVILKDTGRKCLYLVDDSFDSAFPDFDYGAAKRGSFREFREKSQLYVPENEDAVKGIDELDFLGESNRDDSSRWQKDAEQYILDAFKADIPDKLLTREEEQELAKRMKSDMDVIVRALYSDMAKVVS
ncbi:MAG: hypothetical protein KKE20_03980, partial [Nanoarchaeota archaeon]|nr:hypothetical protein [Nanoarchaeota archaeon]